ncbi:ankyrin-3 isoform X1 [Conger conger]|uniref:ankyrin-3 isoform X1 n=1 Tax=Conger conger TaxID=82655 RepID=UPI002A59E337|nr:ankyrin-3 isoform X1 [Conger conger]
MASTESSSTKSVCGLPSVKPTADVMTSKGMLVSSLSSPAKCPVTSMETALLNGTASPIKYACSSSSYGGSLQERIKATTHAATTSVNAAFDEAEKTFNSGSASGYSTLKSMSSSVSSSYQSMRSPAASSIYTSMRSPATSTTSVTSSSITVPVYSFVNVLPEAQVKKHADVTSVTRPASPQRTTTPTDARTQAESSFSRTLSPIKTSLFISPAVLKTTDSSSLSSSQEILKDVAEMKEDLIRMTAILQTDTSSATKSFQTDPPKESKIEDEEPFSIVEKVKEDLVKVSEILKKDVLSESKASMKDKTPEEDWEEFSKDEIEEAQQSARRCPPSYDTVTTPVRTQSISEKDFSLAKVADYLSNDISVNSLSKMSEMRQRYDDAKRDGEEKQKRVLKPAMALQEHKLKMPPSCMRSSSSEKELCKLADSVFGTDAILESPEDFSHDQDKSPLSDSGFETRSEKTPSAPQSAESTGPKPLFQDVPIPPVITETRTEVVHVIRSYDPPEGAPEPVMEEAAEITAPACIEPEPKAGSIKDKVKAFQIKVNTEEDSVVSKAMRLKEETHITTTTRMVYHKPTKDATSERIEETMSVRDIMKAFQSGRDPSKELAGLFEHKAGESHKGNEISPRFLDKDVKAKPKVERIIEVHIEKGNKTDPTEVIIRETKKHPDKELYLHKGDRAIKELPDRFYIDDEAHLEEEELTAEESLPSYLESSRVNTPVSQEEDSRPSSAQLIADDSYKALKLLSQHSIEYHDDELSELRGESYRFAEKMLLSEKLDISHSDTEESVTDQPHIQSSDMHSADSHYGEKMSSGTQKDFFKKPSKDASDNAGKFARKDEHIDKLTVLHYTTEPGSPKHAVWMRFTEDRLDRNREKLIYEDRVDRTVKEAEEKLSEVSQFFRDKTEKLNDELQSPEKKPQKREPRETRSGPSSTCSSPEKTQHKNGASGEEWGKGRLKEPSVGKLFGSSSERKCASLPNSPEKRISSRYNDDKTKQRDIPAQNKASETSQTVQLKSSNVSSVRLKFESEAQKHDKGPQWGPAKPPVKKLQESKLPVYQLFTGAKTPKSADNTDEAGGPKKVPDSDKGKASPSQSPEIIKSRVPVIAPKQSGEKMSNKGLTEATAPKHSQAENGRELDADKEKKIYKTWESHGNGNNKVQKEKLSHTLVPGIIKEDSGPDLQNIISDQEKKQPLKNGAPVKEATPVSITNKNTYTEIVTHSNAEFGDTQSKMQKKESQIPIWMPGSLTDSDQSKKAKPDTLVKPSERSVSHIPTLAKSRSQGSSETSTSRDESSANKYPESLESSSIKDSNDISDPSPVEYIEKQAPIVTAESFKGLKTLPVYVSIQVGKQGEKETPGGQQGTYKKIVSQENRSENRGAFHTVKQKQATSPQGSPEDDTLEQVSFIDSSGKSPLTPETPSSEEVSYDLTSRTPDSFIGFLPSKPSPIPEVSEEEEEQGKAFPFKESPSEKTIPSVADSTKENQEAESQAKDKRVAYIEFPPPPPLDSSSEQSDPEKKGSCPSSEAETEMMEVNLQEEHDKHLLAEPIIRVQPPSPVPPGADDSDSTDEESVFQPIPFKKYTFKIAEEEGEKSKSKKQEKNGNHRESSPNGDGKVDDYDFEQNGNDQSITDCSIATTAEFSHDTDATEIDSLDGYDLQDEDDGLSEEDPKPLSFSCDSRKDMWATESILKPCDRSFSQTKLEVIQEEERIVPEEGRKAKTKSDSFDKNESNGNGQVCPDGRQSGRGGQSDTYFSYKLEEEFSSHFKTVATKGLDFDPWSSKGGDDEVFDSRIKDEEPRPFGLAVDDRSQATTPDTTPARTPTDESTPTSEPNPFPFHEGKMFEMTRSGAIDMSKRDFVEERLQFFQIGEHTSEGKPGDKGEGVKKQDIIISQAQTVEKAVGITLEAPSDVATSTCALIQISSDSREASPDENIEETSSCTMVASKIDPKLRTPIKMGITPSITVKKDADAMESTDSKTDTPDSQTPDHTFPEAQAESKPCRSTDSPKPSEGRGSPTENCNNNNNHESSNIQANYIQCGSVVFNLQSSSQPTLQQVRRVDASSCRDSEKVPESSVPCDKIKTDGTRKTETRQPKSRLPIKVRAPAPCLQVTTAGKEKPKQIVKPESRKKVDNSASMGPKSRIPIKEVKRVKVTPSVSAQGKSHSGKAEPKRTRQVPSRLPVKDRSRASSENGSAGKRGRESTSEVRKHSSEGFKGASGEALKPVGRLSDEEKKTRSELSDDEDSTSRNASLSEPSSQPSFTSRSARVMKTEAAPVRKKVEQAGSERRRSRRTVGKEGSQVAGPHVAPIAEIKPSPQSPCERTDLRMAIVADHLGLSWTELAREMDFSVDEINHIRVENPNSLTAQSFMLLKKWVNRDGKNATTDALTAVLTKINRMDIVTLLEGPIFDYGNISGTRCFADDYAVFRDQADGFHNIELELQSPTELGYEPPTPLRKDDFFSENYSIDSPSSSPCRPSDLSLSQPPYGPAAGAEPPTVVCEDTSLDGQRDREGAEEDPGSAGQNDGANLAQVQEEPVQPSQPEEQKSAGEAQLGAGILAVREGSESGSDEEEEEMTRERLQSLLEDVKLEEGSEGEEMTEERVQAILCQVEQAEKDMCSIPGWHSETSSVNVEPPTPGRSLSSDLIDRQENSPENDNDSFTSASKGQAGSAKQNGEHVQVGSLPAAQDSAGEGQKMPKETERIEGSEDDGPSGAGPSSRDHDSPASEHKVQHGEGGKTKQTEGREKKVQS